MKHTLMGLSALALCAGLMLPAQGADDITQPVCFGWLHRDPPPTRTSNYAVVPAADPGCCPQPACSACPQTTCSQYYTLQSYYKSVTTYQTQTNYEPVTTYRTSYYYEPVVTYRTSCYYCPNTCSWKQTQVPETQYVLKSTSCPVQTYVARCTQVPVTTCQKVYYYQPQTVCTQSPPPCCPAPAPCCPTAAVQGAAPCPNCQPGMAGGSLPANPPQASATPGPTSTFRPPIISDKESNQQNYYDGQRREPPLNGNGGTSWQPVSPPPSPPAATPSAPQAHTVRLDRIVLGADAVVEGELMHSDKTPRANTKILFVNANQPGMRETVTTGHNGRFQITLCPGGWLTYVYNIDGDAVFHSRIEVNDENMAKVVLVK